MYIVNWLKGHPMIAMWVLLLVAFLLYWSGPANSKKVALENHPVSIESTSLEHKKPQNAVKEQQSADDNVAHKIQENHEEKRQSSAIEKDAITKDKIATIDDTLLSNANKLLGGNKTSKEAIKTITNDDSVATKGPFKESAEKLVNKQLPEGAITDLSSSSNEDMLLIAREAYWNNGLDEAAEIYQKLIKLEPNMLDHKGELGNVYWRQGFPKKAAELYSEIAIPMIKEGKNESVANMLGFIGLFYPDRATQINEHLQAKDK